MTRVKTEKRMVREADLVAEVTIELEFTDHEWSPFIKPADVEKLDSARERCAAATFMKPQNTAPFFA